MITNNQPLFHCDKCDFEWRPRFRDKKPKTCLKCKCKNWDGIETQNTTNYRDNLNIPIGN